MLRYMLHNTHYICDMYCHKDCTIYHIDMRHYLDITYLLYITCTKCTYHHEYFYITHECLTWYVLCYILCIIHFYCAPSKCSCRIFCTILITRCICHVTYILLTTYNSICAARPRAEARRVYAR